MTRAYMLDSVSLHCCATSRCNATAILPVPGLILLALITMSYKYESITLSGLECCTCVMLIAYGNACVRSISQRPGAAVSPQDSVAVQAVAARATCSVLQIPCRASVYHHSLPAVLTPPHDREGLAPLCLHQVR